MAVSWAITTISHAVPTKLKAVAVSPKLCVPADALSSRLLADAIQSSLGGSLIPHQRFNSKGLTI